MKKASSVLWGIVLIAAGVVLALNVFNITDIDVASLFPFCEQSNGARDDNKQRPPSVKEHINICNVKNIQC